MDTGNKVLWYVIGALTGGIALLLALTLGTAFISVAASILVVAWPLLILLGIIGLVIWLVRRDR